MKGLSLWLAVMTAIVAQSTARPQFEVASIKPSQGQGLMMVRPLPGRLAADASVRLLIRNAYNVQPSEIVGGPDWMRSERYVIDAKAAGNPGRDAIFLMLRALLEERFQLKLHRDTREMPVYTLTAARGGLKLRTADDACEDPAADGPVDWSEGRMAPPGPPPVLRCGSVSVGLGIPLSWMRGGKITISEFARVLSAVLGRPVIDRTGFTGVFDVKLEFAPDETTAGLPVPPPPPPSAGVPPPDTNALSIVTALQERLGLHLDSARGPVEVLVIDQVERPVANAANRSEF